MTSASLDVLQGADRLGALLARVREAFGLDELVLLDAEGTVLAAAPAGADAAGGVVVPIESGGAMRFIGPALSARSLWGPWTTVPLSFLHLQELQAPSLQPYGRPTPLRMAAVRMASEAWVANARPLGRTEI